MQKYLITGFSGFVAKYFLDYLEKNNIQSKILGLDICQPDINKQYQNIKWEYEQVNLLNKEHLEAIVLNFQPEYILEIPLLEDRILAPVSPYGVARVSQEMLSKIYVKGYGLDIVMTRSFNHLGPGQKEAFVISSFVKQIVSLKKKGLECGEIITGNTSIIRDFLDVRDVAEAYYLLFQKGESGEVYNVCSGNGILLAEVIATIARINNIAITTNIDHKLIRPDDNKIIIGNNEKIKKATGWLPKIDFRQSLIELSDYWRERIY